MAPQADIHEEVILQAVILAVCEQDYGAPVTQDVPKVLVPLANTPLLDYSLDWLERCGVDEAIVYCRADHHLDAIKGHCRAFMGRREDSPTGTTTGGAGGGLRVSVVASEDCRSLGDAMRDLYAKLLLKGDFILLQGDAVMTLDLPSLVTQHRESRTADKSAVMTCVYVDAATSGGGGGGGGGGGVDRATTATLMVSSTTAKLLHHRRRGHRSASKLSVPTELVQDYSDILVYPSAYDPSVTICSEIVPSLFSDNFDYGNLDSLIRGVIEQEELLGYTIKCRVLSRGGYAARASSLPALIRMSGDVVRRRTHPLVAEVSLTSHRVRYSHDTYTNTYWDPSAKFPKGSGVRNAVVGAGTEVSPSVTLSDCVLGDHCSLGEDVRVTDAVVMGNASIKAGCVLEQCWVGERAVLGEGVCVPRGCVIGAGVILGPRVKLSPGTRLSAHPPPDEFGDPGAVVEPDRAVCGEGGRAFLVHQEEEEEDEEEEEEEEEEEGGDVGRGGGGVGGLGEMSGDESEEMEMSDEEEHHRNEFRREVEESLNTALRDGSAAENVVLEINASRHAYNVTMEDVLAVVMQGVLQAGLGRGGAEGAWPGVKAALGTFKDVLGNYIKKGRDQLLVLNALEELAETSPAVLPLVKGVLFELNQTHEILDDEVVVHWYRGGGGGTAAFPALKNQLAKFVEWLEDEDDEEESDGEN